MFVASARRTESNPKTAAAILARGGRLSVSAADVARRAKEEDEKQGAQVVALPAPIVAAAPELVAPAIIADPQTPDLEIQKKLNQKWDNFVAEVKADTHAEPSQYRPTLDSITRRICRVFQVTPRAIASDSRKPGLILPRQAIYYWAYRLTDLSAKRIGELVNGRDHTTVLYGIDMYRTKRARAGRTLRSMRSKK
jgi:hypothetical protein